MTGIMTVEWELARLNTAFAHHLDQRDYDSLIELFLPDAVYDRRGQVLRGHGEIRAAMHDRPADLTIRHLVSNQGWKIKTRVAGTLFALAETLGAR